MSNLEFVFSLFGLLLGLALATVLSGLGNALQERHKIRVGSADSTARPVGGARHRLILDHRVEH